MTGQSIKYSRSKTNYKAALPWQIAFSVYMRNYQRNMGILRNIANYFSPPQSGRDSASRSPSWESTPALPLSEAEPEYNPTRTVGSQQTLDTEQRAYYMPTYGIIPPFDPNTYLTAYLEDPLAKAIVDADVSLITSPFEYVSPNEDVNEYMRDFHKRTHFDRVIREIAFHQSLYGFACPETVGDGASLLQSTKIIRFKSNDPRFMILQKDRYGRITYFRQRPTYSWGMTINNPRLSPYLDIVVEPESIVYVPSMSPFTCYGHSILQSLLGRLSDRNRLIEATVTAHEKFANAVDWLMYESDGSMGEDQADIDAQVDKLEKACQDIIDNKARFMQSGCKAGAYRYLRIGADTLPDATKLIDRLTRDIIISSGFHPAVFAEGEAGQAGETSRYTVETIKARQQWIMSYVHQNLYSLLPYIEPECPADSPDDIVVGLQAPDQTTLIERMQAATTEINNVVLKVRSGIIEPDQGAHELGYPEWFDEDKLTQGANIQDGINKGDPNQDQQVRKAIQSRAAGKEPSNNPKGN